MPSLEFDLCVAVDVGEDVVAEVVRPLASASEILKAEGSSKFVAGIMVNDVDESVQLNPVIV